MTVCLYCKFNTNKQTNKHTTSTLSAFGCSPNVSQRVPPNLPQRVSTKKQLPADLILKLLVKCLK